MLDRKGKGFQLVFFKRRNKRKETLLKKTEESIMIFNIQEGEQFDVYPMPYF